MNACQDSLTLFLEKPTISVFDSSTNAWMHAYIETITHQGGGTEEKSSSTWTYPSPQMFYNALARKGKLGDTNETEMESVVALHNNMNEKTWRKVVEWEETVVGEGGHEQPPKLLKFMGRPKDLSPKAWYKHRILGHPLPFDRHDWTVLRADGSTARYVIDYYYDETRARTDAASALPFLNDAAATPSLLVDVRPALDGVRPLWHRMVTMPLARHVWNSTSFTPLPMSPTPAMKSQVIKQRMESLAAGNVEEEEIEATILSEQEAQALAKDFEMVTKDCHKAQISLNDCQSQHECARASMDWTICMGKGLCELQHTALAKTLRGDDHEAIEAAYARVYECVNLKTAQHSHAKIQYPDLF